MNNDDEALPADGTPRSATSTECANFPFDLGSFLEADDEIEDVPALIAVLLPRKYGGFVGHTMSSRGPH
ncbi:hypothetical protein GUJ93_ZPchr0008g13266 [Zizania palustris]|uniref:Uncharacterized protein n=1 Tax=Zizania palustris TaxID=103762 RepID=A0A8J5RXG0_ZIZPA|nr:hypothetical protein GUJ93_ZPchr0008g13266 [Zizania palustris]